MYKQYKNSPYDIYADGRCYSHLSNKFLTPKMSVTYPTYHLTLENKQKNVTVHRMVAETFLPQPIGKTIVNHIDGDTHNFHLENLEWVTAAENSRHAKKIHKSPNNAIINKWVANYPNEQWKPIKDYPNYMVSSFGRVMNIFTKRLLKAYKDNTGGYLCVNLWKKNRGKIHRVHQLVYTHFYNDFNLTSFVINHKDGDKNNNEYTNLEKISYSQNNYHATYKIKTNKSAKPIVQLNDNKEPIQTFNSIAEATRILHIYNISKAIKKNGKAGGYYWKFK